MTILLDTHTILWFWWNSSSLSQSAKALIADPSNVMLVSHASPWEVSIKVSQQKLDLGRTFAGYFPDQMKLTDMNYLPTTDEHFAELSTLPFHHKDPFDRLMIAQAIVERIPIVSIDTKFDAYPIQRLW
jgi:PIN domain nuclease of toxin-antitoxin system